MSKVLVILVVLHYYKYNVQSFIITHFAFHAMLHLGFCTDDLLSDAVTDSCSFLENVYTIQ